MVCLSTVYRYFQTGFEAALQVIDSIVLSHFQPFIFHVLYACVLTVVENTAQGCTAVGQLFDAVGGQLQVGFSAV